MKKIKLAILALALVCGSVGAYGKKMQHIYYIIPSTAYSAHDFIIAASSPSLNCNAGAQGYVCTVSTAEPHPVGYAIPSQEVTILTVYE